ncbi:hypothetical protein KC320_g173 [Hortaea werneckii]|nr:hypothetical protein KC320_g173 [Hortaea werneckii]
MFKASTVLMALNASSATVAASEDPSPAFLPLFCSGTETSPIKSRIASRLEDKIRAKAHHLAGTEIVEEADILLQQSQQILFSYLSRYPSPGVLPSCGRDPFQTKRSNGEINQSPSPRWDIRSGPSGFVPGSQRDRLWKPIFEYYLKNRSLRCRMKRDEKRVVVSRSLESLGTSSPRRLQHRKDRIPVRTVFAVGQKRTNASFCEIACIPSLGQVSHAAYRAPTQHLRARLLWLDLTLWPAACDVRDFLLLSSLSFGHFYPNQGRSFCRSSAVSSLLRRSITVTFPRVQHNVRHIDLAVNLLHEERHLIRDLDVLRMVMDQTIFSALPRAREEGE